MPMCAWATPKKAAPASENETGEGRIVKGTEISQEVMGRGWERLLHAVLRDRTPESSAWNRDRM